MSRFKETQAQIKVDSNALRRVHRVIKSILDSANQPLWTKHIPLPKSKDLVPAWRLAQHFLITWIEWSSLLARWRSLYPSAHESSDWLKRYDHDFRKTAQELAADDTLLALISSDISSYVQRESTAPINANSALDQLLSLDELVMLADWLASSSASPDNPIGNLVVQLQTGISGRYDLLPKKFHPWVDSCLEHYRRSKLQYTFERSNSNDSFLLLLTNTKPLTTMIEIHRERSQDNYNAIGVIEKHLPSLLNELQKYIGEAGYRDLIDDLLDGNPPSIVTAPHINILPGSGSGSCAPLLIAFSSGESKRSPIGYSNVLGEIRSHLIKCGPGRTSSSSATQVVVLFCDFWDSAEFDSFFNDFATFHSQGVEFIFLLSGAPRKRSVFNEVKVFFK
jgi:hypothetical protein